MGQWRLSFYFRLQLGFIVSYDPEEAIIIGLPLIEICVGLTEDACGVSFFNDI